MLRILLALLVAAAPLAQAETYKWVDERGVINYSNSPPPESAKGSIPLQPVPDRVSTYQTDPATSQSIEVYRRLDANQQEWLQRQQLMAFQQAQAAAQPVATDYYAPYGYFYNRRPVRPAVFNAIRPIAPRPQPRRF
jgi:hypothetical protein